MINDVIYRAFTINEDDLRKMVHDYLLGIDIIAELDKQLFKMGLDFVKFDNIEISKDIELNELNIYVLNLVISEFKRRKEFALLNPKYRKITEYYEVMDILK